MEKIKVHMNDILESEIQEPRKILILRDKKYYADRMSKEQLSTHADCEKCKKEFEKQYTNDRHCHDCGYSIKSEKYLALPLVEWDGKTALTMWDGDEYFFDVDDIQSYCEDNECQPSDLRLVLCKQSSFRTIDFDFWQDDVHEDWEPDNELIKRVEALNNYLSTASTNTWFADNKRVSLSDLKL